MDSLILRNNADLANDWGNLVNRSITMVRKYFPDQMLKPPAQATHSAQVRQSFEKLILELREFLDQIEPSKYIAACNARSRLLNLYIDQMKPWALAKVGTPEARSDLAEVLSALLEGIRWLATAFLPVLPFGMPEVFRQLGLAEPQKIGSLTSLEWGAIEFRVGEPKPIYPRLELPVDSKPGA